jgi:5'-deoxynucleotidase YfbR-like HD superfamily hydrolase
MSAQIAPWMQTIGGRAVDLLSPRPDQIELSDIAASLDRLPRFNGHTQERVWTVTKHSHLVANLLTHVIPEEEDPHLRLAALLHDAHEAYTGDITAPMKAALCSLVGYDPIKPIAKRLQGVIHARFHLPVGLPSAWGEAIHRADLMALHMEKRAFMAPEPRPWVYLPEIPEDAEEELEAVELYGRVCGGQVGFAQLVNAALEEIENAG